MGATGSFAARVTGLARSPQAASHTQGSFRGDLGPSSLLTRESYTAWGHQLSPGDTLVYFFRFKAFLVGYTIISCFMN